MVHIRLLFAALEALPILDKWFQQATIAYVKMQKEKNNVEYLEAMGVAKADKDVTGLAANLGGKL
ncbi:hypothetical protein UFOVP903_41 [uncultured Caudovirales phage]|uniref:Uncharacterized protein n=1 Tax=uncultured Caudovirales phage TaxID=2100421 RepID=A0A6J5PLD1_9CAUD|nr:hypothetical protein UFOVP903_41 [uncultured Caudovirales phage]CAB4197251.1 hypothetical protein UFOVP1318_5 [uncultured Caudovirales phage]CAB4210721.1 hypothetical protein UFOVP1430_39 [uncultured Caudovirales phage]